jgi:hypothetical protein
LSPELPAAANPPDGAVIDYYLKAAPAGEIEMGIYDAAGKLVRSYSSAGAASLGYKVNVPDYWLAPASVLPKTAGLHRFAWDLRYPDPEQLLYTYYGVHVDYFEYTLADHAIPHNTPWHEPQGPMVLPGQYEIRLTAGGQTLRQPITVTMDPRLSVSLPELRQQLDLAQKIAAAMGATSQGYNQAAQLHADLASRVTALKQAGKSPETITAAEALDGKSQAAANAAGPPAGMGPMNRDLTRLMIAVGQADTAPAGMVTEAFDAMCRDTSDAMARWKDLVTVELPKLNAMLTQQGGAALTGPRAIADGYCGK